MASTPLTRDAVVGASPLLASATLLLGAGIAGYAMEKLGAGIANDLNFGYAAASFQLAATQLRWKGSTIADVWEETARKRRTREAIVFAGKALTFQELDQAVNRICAVLVVCGYAPRSTVAVCMTNSPAFVATHLALSKLGLSAAFINTNLKAAPLVHSISVAEPVAIVCDTETYPAIHAELPHMQASRKGAPPMDVRVWQDTSLAPSRTAGNVAPEQPVRSSTEPTAVALTSTEPSLDSLIALIPCDVGAPPRSARAGLDMSSCWGYIYTSGTTGLPKPAVISHLRYFMAGYLMSHVAGIRESDRVYCALPLYHSAGGMIGCGTMVTRGCTFILAKKYSTSSWWSDISAYQATVVQYIGELCRYLIAAPPHACERAHRVRIALGNGLRPDVWPKFQERFGIPTVVEFYASTEGNASLVNVCSKPADQGAVGRYGIVVRSLGMLRIVKYDEDTESLVRNADGWCVECKAGEVGELLSIVSEGDSTGLRSFSGYQGNKEASEKKIARGVFKAGDAYFRSGDLLRCSPSGHYYFVDRIGDTYRWKSENIASTEVAEVIGAYPGITESIVYGAAIPGYDGRCGMAALILSSDEHAEGASGTTATAATDSDSDTTSGNGNASASVIRVPALVPLDLKAFAAHLRASLPAYAIPLFLRILPAAPVTGTFKHIKKELRDAGADPMLVTADPLYRYDADSVTYVPHTLDSWHDIVGGKARL